MQLKDLYSEEFYSFFGDILNESLETFNKKAFTKEIFNNEWSSLELKDRLRHTSYVLKNYLNNDPVVACQEIVDMVTLMQSKDITKLALEFMFLPDYIEKNAIDNLDVAMDTFVKITGFTSCEFAIRPFIVKYHDASLIWLINMSKHENEHVRRLASEGSRSRLPWAMALPIFKKDPTPIIPILQNLKDDPSEYVRRSVANNLNDITKDNPELALDIFGSWIGKNVLKDKIVKHGARTLLKAGEPRAMALFNYGHINNYAFTVFKVNTKNVQIGEYMSFSFELKNTSTSMVKTRLEYAIYYLKANGTNTKKVFKISERELMPNEVLTVTKKQSFKIISTRKFHKGIHYVSPIVNGIEMGKEAFELI